MRGGKNGQGKMKLVVPTKGDKGMEDVVSDVSGKSEIDRSPQRR